jgi:hypothetical protein
MKGYFSDTFESQSIPNRVQSILGQQTTGFLVKAGQLYYNKQRNYGILAM